MLFQFSFLDSKATTLAHLFIAIGRNLNSVAIHKQKTLKRKLAKKRYGRKI